MRALQLESPKSFRFVDLVAPAGKTVGTRPSSRYSKHP